MNEQVNAPQERTCKRTIKYEDEFDDTTSYGEDYFKIIDAKIKELEE